MRDSERRLGITPPPDRARFTYDVRAVELPAGFIAPFRINYETNEICNMRCGFCFADYHEGETAHENLGISTFGQLNTAEVRGMMDQAAQMGTTQFLLGGGDPFIRSDMPDLIEHADGSGLQVLVDTNGLLLSRRAGLLERVAPHIHQLGLSLDGPTPIAHDTFRDTHSSFEAVMDLIQRSEEHGYKLKINTIVTAENAVDILQMVGILAPYAGQISRWSLDQFIPANRGKSNQDRYLISDKEYLDVVDSVKTRADEKFNGVVIGGGLKKDKAGTVMLFGPQGIPYFRSDESEQYVPGNIRTHPLFTLVQMAEDKGLKVGAMNEVRYGDIYYITNKRDKQTSISVKNPETTLTSQSQRDLWNTQHATRGASSIESEELTFAPNEVAVLLHECLAPASRIMEVGAANGRDARYWASKGHTVMALDFSDVALLQLQEIAREQGVLDKIDAKEWDICDGDLPPTDGPIDAFYARSALHIDDTTMMGLAVNIDTILSPGGYIVIEGKGPKNDKIARSTQIGGNLVVDPFENGHLRRVWTTDFTKEMCNKMGWNILEISHAAQAWDGEPADFMRLVAKKR